MTKRGTTKRLVAMGLLIAMEIIFTRFLSVHITLLGSFTDNIHLGFLPVAVGGMFFGGAWGGIIAAIADALRALIFPTGAFNPLFTISAALRGVLYGLFLHKKAKPANILLSSAVIFFFINILLLSLFLKISYYPDTPYFTICVSKAVVSFVNFVIQAIVLTIALPTVEKNLKNLY